MHRTFLAQSGLFDLWNARPEFKVIRAFLVLQVMHRQEQLWYRSFHSSNFATPGRHDRLQPLVPSHVRAGIMRKARPQRRLGRAFFNVQTTRVALTSCFRRSGKGRHDQGRKEIVPHSPSKTDRGRSDQYFTPSTTFPLRVEAGAMRYSQSYLPCASDVLRKVQLRQERRAFSFLCCTQAGATIASHFP